MTDGDRLVSDDQLVQDYLRRLRRAARGLPRARRRELLDEIAAHIAEARAASQATSGDAGELGAAAATRETDSPGSAGAGAGESVRAVLASLGDPREIVRAAGGPNMSGRPGAKEIAAVLLLLGGGTLLLVGWVVGCVLLWMSPRWRWHEKLLGTLVWPGGLVGPVIFAWTTMAVPTQRCVVTPGGSMACVGNHIVPGLGIIAVVLIFSLPLLVAGFLLLRARRVPYRAAAEPTLTPAG
jgi:hypothetical protein